jgi:hypothetical protein
MRCPAHLQNTGEHTMGWKYVPKANCTVKDWIGSWGNGNNPGDFQVGGAITQKQADTIHINFSDSGSAGGATGNPQAIKLPFPKLDINTDVDTSTAKSKLMESLVVENTIFLGADGVTLTYMVLVPGQPNAAGAPPKVIQYHREWHGSQTLGVSINLTPEVPPGAPR